MIHSAYLSQLRPKKKIKQQLETWGFRKHKIWSQWWYGVRVYVAEHEDFVLVGFRGTKTLTQNISNAMFAQVEAEGFAGQAHRGVFDAYLRTRKKIRQLILDHGGGNKPLIFTGHSRGAMMATLFSLDALSLGQKVESVYAFSQPRLGDQQFHDYIQSKIGDRYYRIENKDDIGPQIPPTADESEAIGQLVLGDENQSVENAAKKLIVKLGYTYGVGAGFFLDGDRLVPSSDTESQRKIQLDFWKTFGSEISLKSISSIVSTLSTHIVEHKPSEYICKIEAVMKAGASEYLRKNLDQSN